MQALSTKYQMGISIDQVQLKDINPPQPVQESFNEVNQVQQEKEKLINEARRDYNKVIPLAEGEKDQRIREADALFVTFGELTNDALAHLCEAALFHHRVDPFPSAFVAQSL